MYATDEQNILTLRSQRNITQPKNNFVRKGVSLSEVRAPVFAGRSAFSTGIKTMLVKICEHCAK